MSYHCRLINLQEGCREEYIRLHQSPRAQVQKVMKDHGIARHAIFIKGDLLVSWFEYTGEDFDGDMKAIGDHPDTKAWWQKISPLQSPLEERKPGEWWAFADLIASYG